MFKISTRPRVIHPVPLFIEVDGERVDCSFAAKFEIQPISKTEEADLNTADLQGAFLLKAVVDLQDLVDDADKPVPFSLELLRALLDRVEVRTALFGAYFDAARKAALGN